MLSPYTGEGYKPEQDGVVLVMLEQMDSRLHKFLDSGRVAIGLNSILSLETYVHMDEICYVVFHTWNNSTYRIFEILGEPVMEKTIVNIP